MTKTVKVLVAVAVDCNGDWSAAGWKGVSTDEARDNAVEGIGAEPFRVFWLTAELPLPVEEEIAAHVAEDAP